MLAVLCRCFPVKFGSYKLFELCFWDLLGGWCNWVHQLCCRPFSARHRSNLMPELRRRNIPCDPWRSVVDQLLKLFYRNLQPIYRLHIMSKLRIGNVSGERWPDSMLSVLGGYVLGIGSKHMLQLHCRLV